MTYKFRIDHKHFGINNLFFCQVEAKSEIQRVIVMAELSYNVRKLIYGLSYVTTKATLSR